MRLDWKTIGADGTDIHPGELRSVRVGFGDDGSHIKGAALVAQTDSDLIDHVGGEWWYEVDALAVEGDQGLELHVPPTPCDSVEEGMAIVERLLTAHNAVQASTIVAG